MKSEVASIVSITLSLELPKLSNQNYTKNQLTCAAIGAKTNSIDLVWTRDDNSLPDIFEAMFIPFLHC